MTRACTLALSLPPSFSSQEEAICKPGRELSPGTESANHLDLGVQNCETPELREVNVYCLSYTVCRVLLWQPEQTKTVIKKIERPTTSAMSVFRALGETPELKIRIQMQCDFLWKCPLEIDSTIGCDYYYFHYSL